MTGPPTRQRPPAGTPADESDHHLAGEIDPKATDHGAWIDDARLCLRTATERKPWPSVRIGSRHTASPLLRYLELREMVGGGRD